MRHKALLFNRGRISAGWLLEKSVSLAEGLRNQILNLVQDYHAAAFAERPFVPGESPVPVSGRVFGAHGVENNTTIWV